MIHPFEDHVWKDVIAPETFKIYEHYHRKTYVGSRPALLAIDLYNLSYEGGSRPVHELVDQYPSSCGENAWNALQPTIELFEIARANQIPIIYSTKDQSSGGIDATFRRAGNDSYNAYEIKEELAPQPGDIMIYKQRASCFFGTPLIAHLQRLDVNSLIVCGESTSGCVRATVVDAYSYGLHVSMAEECCFDRHMLSHKINLFDLHHKYADVMKVSEIKEHFSK